MTTVLHESVEKKGTFRLTNSVASLKKAIKEIPFDYESCEEDENGNPIMSQEQIEDIKRFEVFDAEDFDWSETFARIPRKKNGTFYNNRALVLVRGHSFAWEDEDCYGMRGPELRIKTLSDTEAQLEFHWTIIEKW